MRPHPGARNRPTRVGVTGTFKFTDYDGSPGAAAAAGPATESRRVLAGARRRRGCGGRQPPPAGSESNLNFGNLSGCRGPPAGLRVSHDGASHWDGPGPGVGLGPIRPGSDGRRARGSRAPAGWPGRWPGLGQGPRPLMPRATTRDRPGP